MKKLKKILLLVLWFGLATGLLVSLGFVNQKQSMMRFSGLEVNINQDDDLYFLDKKDIVQLLYNRGDSVVGKKRIQVDVPKIEQALNSHENIANAEVFATIDGKLKIKVKQRKPIVRVFNVRGDSYYIDQDAMLMPVSAKYTANVIIANGYIDESYVLNCKYPVNVPLQDSLRNSKAMLGKLFAMAAYIQADKFWSNQVQQIYVNQNHEMEIVPLVGNHKIIFGDTIDMAEKFNKLYTFYHQGLNVTGWWNKYSVINLKFKNQIVCTKKMNS